MGVADRGYPKRKIDASTLEKSVCVRARCDGLDHGTAGGPIEARMTCEDGDELQHLTGRHQWSANLRLTARKSRACSGRDQ